MSSSRALSYFSKITSKLLDTTSQKYIVNAINRYTTTANLTEEKERIVYISTSNDIHTNLALEDWLYNNFKSDKRNALLLWQNEPCVVIGKFQNPWLEANISNLKNSNIKLARRSSGGGTVYHDMGNLNLTFFTTKKDYNRKKNLTFIKEVLEKYYSIRTEINKREDLVINECKISGTAAKLGKETVYHHCTILVNVNKFNLHSALNVENTCIETKASKSVKSKIINLSDINLGITADDLLYYLAYEFSDKIQIVTPSEEHFSDITQTIGTFKSWNWCFGKTPKFTVTRTFKVPADISNSDDEIYINILVEEGIISDVSLTVPMNLVKSNFDHNFKIIDSMKGEKYSEDILVLLDKTFLQEDQPSKFIFECLKKTVENRL